MTIVEACESKTNTTPDFPMGWFSVSRSHELQVGEVKSVTAFDRELALYRTRSGRAVLQDAFCPHLGAHLGHGGTVQGESLRCPFHHWQYSTEGVITDIPYASRIPPKIAGKPCLKTYPVCEKNDVIWAWYHPEDAAPDHEVIEWPAEILAGHDPQLEKAVELALEVG